MAHMGLNQYLQQVKFCVIAHDKWKIHLYTAKFSKSMVDTSHYFTFFAIEGIVPLVCVQVEQCIRIGDGDVLAVSQLQAVCMPVMLHCIYL